MSGIEIAGLVLGSFPIMLNCLEYYREGLEPLDNWLHFRKHFIAFVDEIEHQMMRYTENMIRLLDPIVKDNDSLVALVHDTADPRWTDDQGTLDKLVKNRLTSEHGRFLRIMHRMDETVRALKKFLGIKDGDVRWLGPEQHRPWEWHLKRLQISFSKGKAKKIKKLGLHNEELQEILGYSERVMPIADKRHSSDPVAHFERLFQHAWAIHNALSRNWKCSSQGCGSHQANLCLQAETEDIRFKVLFILEDQHRPVKPPKKQEVIIRPVKTGVGRYGQTMQIGRVHRSRDFAAMQERFGLMALDQRSSNDNTLSWLRPKTMPIAATTGSRTPAIIVSPDQDKILPAASSGSHGTSQGITNLCFSLRKCASPSLGVMLDEFDRQLELLTTTDSSLAPTAPAPDTAELVSLTEILKAYQEASIEIDRKRRFQWALHIASALLQIQTSPWLRGRWSKHNFRFLADSQSVYSDNPYLSQTFTANATNSSTISDPVGPESFTSEEDTRSSLFTVGVIVLELIFGHSIEACSFRHLYYGSDDQPNDQTDISTARRWSKKVLGECGVEIADVVRRCLDCSFGPRPNLRDKRFREAVHDGVIRPLADYLRIWQATVP